MTSLKMIKAVKTWWKWGHCPSESCRGLPRHESCRGAVCMYHPTWMWPHCVNTATSLVPLEMVVSTHQSCALHTSHRNCQSSSHFFGDLKSCLPDAVAALRAPQLLTDTWLSLKTPWGQLLTPRTGTTAAVIANSTPISALEAPHKNPAF